MSLPTRHASSLLFFSTLGAISEYPNLLGLGGYKSPSLKSKPFSFYTDPRLQMGELRGGQSINS